MQALLHRFRRERIEVTAGPLRRPAKQPFDAGAQTAKCRLRCRAAKRRAVSVFRHPGGGSTALRRLGVLDQSLHLGTTISGTARLSVVVSAARRNQNRPFLVTKTFNS